MHQTAAVLREAFYEILFIFMTWVQSELDLCEPYLGEECWEMRYFH